MRHENGNLFSIKKDDNPEIYVNSNQLFEILVNSLDITTIFE